MSFQLTRSRGAWRKFWTCSFFLRRFQLTRSRGAWRIDYIIIYVFCHFNSHAHVERDEHNKVYVFHIQISTHTLTWSVTIDFKLYNISLVFQLTRSRGAWLKEIIQKRQHKTISTHTLTWSVTRTCQHTQTRPEQISTHTLTWSVTRAVAAQRATAEISTHTLTWSVTILLLLPSLFHHNFNSHAHVERDWRHWFLSTAIRISTHTLTWSVTSFIWSAITVIAISTHTLTWSVTRTRITLSWLLIFQLTRSRGAWLGLSMQSPSQMTFQLTRSRGAWQSGSILAERKYNFNSHAHVERDLFAVEKNYLLLNFNSHAHVERDMKTLSFTLKKADFNSHAHVERDAQSRL